jgi:hypothetical protein
MANMGDQQSRTLRNRKLIRILRIVGISCGLIFIGLQAVPVDRSNPPVVADFDGPAEIKSILVAKCYDCHSNETKWLWYSYVAPLSWWVSDHVTEGRAELNFSKWGEYSADKQEEKTGEIYDEVLDAFMPLPSYLIMHPGTKVTEAEFALIEQWLDGDLE